MPLVFSSFSTRFIVPRKLRGTMKRVG